MLTRTGHLKQGAANLSWTRAQRLAKLADHNKSSDARSYLATLNGDSDHTILDTNADKRTNTIQDMVTGFQTWLNAGNKSTHGGSGPRRSHGDPGKEPRAGARPKRKYTRRRGLLSDATTIPTISRGFDPSQISTEVIFEIRAIQKKHRISLEGIQYCTEMLGRIQDN